MGGLAGQPSWLSLRTEAGRAPGGVGGQAVLQGVVWVGGLDGERGAVGSRLGGNDGSGVEEGDWGTGGGRMTSCRRWGASGLAGGGVGQGVGG